MVDPELALAASLILPFATVLPILFGGSLKPATVPSRWPGYLALAQSICTLPLSILVAPLTRHGGSLWARAGEWIPGFGPALALHLDWLSSWLLLLLEIVGLMVLVFSLGYMREERDQRRYFGGLLFFIGMMKLLILAGSYLLVFAGWEGVGLASYVLIGYHFERPFAAAAATKAFIVNRIGDAGFILAILALVSTCGSTVFSDVAQAQISHGTIVFVCSMLAIAAIGKSAQFPLHIWLPDAMEGPTPVSALIHSATMVCAGVYLLARSAPLLVHAPEVGLGVSILGTITALFAATVALAETDIKRVLAYSTISQIGFMFIALGVGAARPAMFHVVTHAFFKSLLFLGAGSIIHALHGEQNLMHMGGLRAKLPVTFWTMAIGALTLAGIPGLSAFLSKDLILESAAHSGHTILVAAGFATSLLTAIYAWRMIALAFFGHSRSHHLEPHEGSRSMLIPLCVLAACCVLTGWIFVPVHWQAWPAMTLSALLAFGGVAIAWYLYIVNPDARAGIDTRFAGVAHALRNRWYIDAVYEEHFVEGIVLRTAVGAAAADTLLIDGAVNGAAWISEQLSTASAWFDRHAVDRSVGIVSATTRFLSWPLRATQTGIVQTYTLLFITAATIAIAFYLAR